MMVRPFRPDAGQDAGLTLVELLVVLAVLGLLSVLATAGLHAAAQGWQSIVRHNVEREELQATSQQLCRLLTQIYPAKVRNNNSPAATAATMTSATAATDMTTAAAAMTSAKAGATVRFYGDARRMVFLAPLAPRFGASDMVLYTLRFADDGTLRISWRLDRPQAGSVESPARAEDVIAGIANGTFDYYGQREEGGETGWWTTWTEQQRLPRLIRVRFTAHGAVEEQVIAPIITAEFGSSDQPPVSGQMKN